MKKIIILLLLTSLLISCAQKEDLQVHKVYKTALVSTGIVNVNDNFIWYTKGVKQAMLATKAPGRITYMAKKIWDKVNLWELLVSLDSSEARSAYSTANKIVSHLYSIREKTSKALDEQIKSLEAKKESVKAQVSGATTGLEDTKEITQKQLQTAKTNLEQTKKLMEAKKESILTWAKSSLTHASIISTNSMDFVKNLLWMDKSDHEFNDKIDDYLGMKDTIQLKNTENLYKQIKPEFEDYKKYYEENIENKENIDEEILKTWLKKAENLLNKIKKLLNETYTVVDNSIENVYMPLSMINNLKEKITNLWVSVEKTLLSSDWWMLLWVSWSLENLKNFETEKQKAISLLEKQVEQYEAMAKWQVNWVETKKKLAELWLNEIEAWLQALRAKKQATLREIDTKIAEALWKKDSAWIMISNWNIYAPFSGIVTNKMSEQWQVTNAWMPIYEIADNRKIKLKIWVPANILKNLRLWDKLDVNIESSNKSFVWNITNISKSANPITKKYEIEITLNNTKKEIPVWEMAIVSFNTDFKNNEDWNTSLRIPNSAIVEKFMIPWVYVLDWKKAKFKEIEILKMWEYFSKVKWLKIWDKVITQWKENIYDWEILK